MKSLKIGIVAAVLFLIQGIAFAGTLTINGDGYYINRATQYPSGASQGYAADNGFATGVKLSPSGGSVYDFRGFVEFPLASWYAIESGNDITGITFLANYSAGNSAPNINIYAMSSAYEDGTRTANGDNFTNSIGSYITGLSSFQYNPFLVLDGDANPALFLNDIGVGQAYSGMAIVTTPEYYYQPGREVWFSSPRLLISYEAKSTVVPEPSTLLLVGTCLMGLVFKRRLF